MGGGVLVGVIAARYARLVRSDEGYISMDRRDVPREPS
jgi:hypothetical protein